MNYAKLWDRCARAGLWTLIIAVSFWSFNRNEWISNALANYVTIDPTRTVTSTLTAANGAVITATEVLFGTTTHTSTQTGTFSNGDGPHTSTGSNTDTNCVTGGSQYGGGQWNYCNRTDPTQQKKTQDDTKDLNDKGSDQSTALGMAAIAAGMAMVMAGMALMANPPTMPAGIALVAAGMALIAAGMAALAAASKMNNNANKAGNNSGNLDNLSTPYQNTISGAPGATNTSTGSSDIGSGVDTGGNGNGSGIKIDPALLRTGKMDGIFADMEKKTGLNRDDLAKNLAGGGDPLAALANAPAMAGKPAGSQANLQKMMDDTLAKGNLPDANAVMDKLGLTQGDLGGADVNRNISSSGGNSGPNIDALFPGKEVPVGPSGGGDSGMKLSAEVQAALDKNGITGRSIFEMIHAQYVKKTPTMFGVQPKGDALAPNPYSSGDKVDL